MSTSSLRPGRAFDLGVVLALALVLCPQFRSTMTARAEQPKSQDRPFVAEYYYKARWGYADEFIRLFKKNHLPVLKKQIETGASSGFQRSSRATTPPRTGGGTTASPSSSRMWRRRTTPLARRRSRRNFSRTRRTSSAKNKGDSRSYWRTGTSRSRTWTWTSSRLDVGIVTTVLHLRAPGITTCGRRTTPRRADAYRRQSLNLAQGLE